MGNGVAELGSPRGSNRLPATSAPSAGDRRTQVVRLTDEGERLFVALAGAAQEFDKRLRRGLKTDEVAQLDVLLQRLHANAGVRGSVLPGRPVA
jgi:hypothetical protein